MCTAQKLLEFRPAHFDRIEIRRVGRKASATPVMPYENLENALYWAYSEKTRGVNRGLNDSARTRSADLE